jgi:hypothetical protein
VHFTAVGFVCSVALANAAARSLFSQPKESCNAPLRDTCVTLRGSKRALEQRQTLLWQRCANFYRVVDRFTFVVENPDRAGGTLLRPPKELNFHYGRVVDADEFTPPLRNGWQHLLHCLLERRIISEFTATAVPNQYDLRPIELFEYIQEPTVCLL